MTHQEPNDTNPYQSASISADPKTSPTSAQTQKSFGAKAAQLSWQLPIAAILVNIVLGAASPDTKRVIGGLCSFLIVVGLIAGVIALISISRFGWRRILIPACFGILINGGFIYLVVDVILSMRAMTEGQ